MGNYNCQECITKEMNFMNELLIDTNLLSPEEQIEEQKTYESKIKKYKKIKPKEEDIKKLTESKDSSEDKKKFVEKTKNKNSLEKYIKNNNNKVKKEKEKENNNIPDVKITTLEPLKENNNDIIINLEDELKNLNEFTLGIEKSFDINRLINQQEKNLKPISINKIIFIPYSLKIFDKMEKEKFSKTKSITLNHFIDVVIKMKNNFKQIAESFNEEIEREKNFILEEAKYILDSSTLISIEQSKFDKLLNLLNNRENRLFFMISLNKIRAEGNFEITFHGTFKQLGIILKFILEKIKKEKKY